MIDNREQFTLDKYLADPSRKVETRDGRPARIICTDCKDERYPIIALILHADVEGAESPLTFKKSGRYCDADDDLDLFFAAPEPRYRPYANADECFKDVLKHGGWIDGHMCDHHKAMITYVSNQSAYISASENGIIRFEDMVYNYSWCDDNSPCGIKEE